MAQITVQAGPLTKDGQVALWERNDQHPDGEVFVVGGGPAVKVAETALVRERLARDLLARVDAPRASANSDSGKREGS